MSNTTQIPISISDDDLCRGRGCEHLVDTISGQFCESGFPAICDEDGYVVSCAAFRQCAGADK